MDFLLAPARAAMDLYSKNGLVDREDLGEQNFVWDMVKHAELLLQPAHWCFKESPEYPERYIYAFEN